MKCACWSVLWELPLFVGGLAFGVLMGSTAEHFTVKVYSTTAVAVAVGAIAWSLKHVALTWSSGLGLHRYVATADGLKVAEWKNSLVVPWELVTEIGPHTQPNGDGLGGWYRPFTIVWDEHGTSRTVEIQHVPFRWKFEDARELLLELWKAP